jgi:hypothetical protein
LIITKKKIPRRAILRGIGVSIALPFLDSMVPAQTPLRSTAASSKTRLACIEMVHGSAGSTDEGIKRHFWSPEKAGADFQFSYSLEPLAPFRDYVTIVSGTDARPAEAVEPSEVGADHFRSSAVFLTGTHPKQASDDGVRGGTSIDQLYAQQFGQDTPIPSIQLAIENLDPAGQCGFSYSCAYSETISWASPTMPLPMKINPRRVFESLFGAGPAGRSVMDVVLPGIARINGKIGPEDRTRLDSYLHEIRNIETRIERVEKRNASGEPRELLAAPLGVPDSWEEHVKLMFDLQALAFAGEITRVSAFKMSHDTSNRLFPESEVQEPFHTLSHHREVPELLAEFAKLNRYHVSMVPYFLNKLKNTPDGDGSLLDHSLILYGSPMGDSNTHNHRRVPLFLAGRANGRLKGNLHYTCNAGTPQANVLLTVMRKLGLEIASVGDSNGDVPI